MLRLLAVGLCLLALGCEPGNWDTLTKAALQPSPPTGARSPLPTVFPTAVPSAQPNPTPRPSPPPSVAPQPTPTAAPTPTGSNPVARVQIRVEYVVCGGQVVPNSSGASETSVGCKYHLDMNAKDANNRRTDMQGQPDWHWDPEDLINFQADSFTPILHGKQAGTLRIWGRVDGVDSNTLFLTFAN